MEIDLELPSGQEDKLDTRLDTNFGGTDGLLAREDEINSPRTGRDIEGNPGPNMGENLSTSGEGANENALGLDAFGKQVKSFEPQKGLEFESKEAAYSFYREYARKSNSEISSRLHYRVQRFNDLCKRAIKLGEEASLSQETYDTVICALQKAMEHCVGVNNSVKCVLEPNNLLCIEEENQGNSVVKTSKKKKIYKKRKVQSETEVITSGVQDSNQQMGQLNSGAHSLDNTFVPQQDIPGMGQLISLSSIRDGYYSNQQAIQGLGQLNSIPMRVGHYGPQQSLQGLLQGQLGFRAATMHGCFNIRDSLHDMEQSVAGSRQFQNIVSKPLQDKHLPP
ncbi:Protein FAR-RED ELONGATED HYPOCOTYL 3 [Camellia lanceoleosa]|uniref:Protein FAR-RED ELONGATED HYPOCOTYL 3 n=1 Tax=Camellia lanceoleosa TaxID=1840588 RepID=A0ACC0H7Y0_9ERIC|nr:Protein FAR-RED ELONGATED HYPOCOTYL 3 [Camellia lanceoleosa]